MSRNKVGAQAAVAAAAAAITFSCLAGPGPASAQTGRPGRSGQTPAAGKTAAGIQTYSTLTGITPGNVHQLAGTWLDQLEGATTSRAQEGTPTVVGGKLYVQTSQGNVFSIDGATGQVIWEFQSGFPGTERGVAVADGHVFAALGREHVVSLNQQTGKQEWLTQVGTPGQDTSANGSATPWTMFADGMVLVGTENGGDSGMRGHLYALNESTGKVAWTFAGTAGPGQPGHGTWKGNSWQLGGGDIWMAPAFDAKLGLLYVAVANPQPRVMGAQRAGANLYTNSLVALHAGTGKIDWTFQSIRHDLWDYDNTMTPVLASVKYKAGVKTVVIYGSKSAWLYYLDAKTGKPAIGVHNEKVPQLASQATAKTQPIPAGQSLVPTCPQKTGVTQPIPDYKSGCQFTPYLHTPVLVTPGGAGGANWAAMSFDPKTKLLYVPAAELNFAYSDGIPFNQPTFYKPEGEFRGGVLDAVNPATNKIAWKVPTPFGLSNGDGVLSTASGLLFEGSPDGKFTARLASTGKPEWTWQTGAGIETTPVTYSINGTQYVVVFAGGNGAFNSQFGDSLWAFKIGGKLTPASPPPALSNRVPVPGVAVAGSAVSDTVVLGRTWNSTSGAPNTTENLSSQVAMAPTIMTVPTGTTVTFSNPAGNSRKHCAQGFFDPIDFKIGPLAPGHSGSVKLTKPGTYFYNDCAGFPWNTGEIIVG
jgi:PQQ-dependent dehydrogenase (methanol/ethanol family)